MTHESVESATYTTSQLAEFAGVYYSNEIDATYIITLLEDKLVLRRKNVDGETPMLAQFADNFRVAAAAVPAVSSASMSTPAAAPAPAAAVKELNALALMWTVFTGWLAGLIGKTGKTGNKT